VLAGRGLKKIAGLGLTRTAPFRNMKEVQIFYGDRLQDSRSGRFTSRYR
jgi:hypothetical protein